MNEELEKLGYEGNFSLSHIIDGIRITYRFNIWVEHGSTTKGVKNHDITTDFGCHRGGYHKYEDAQKKGIEIFLTHKHNTNEQN